MHQLPKETEGETMNRKTGIKLEQGGKSPVIALPQEVYDDLTELKQPNPKTGSLEPYHSVVQRLIKFYRGNL